MSLSSTVTEDNVKEAHRLFKVSTLSAASSEFKSGYDVPSDLAPIILRVEETIRRRLAIGAKISYSKLIEELAIRYTSHKAIEYVICYNSRQLLI
jgi:DNA replication licensing factor MCM5